MYHTLKKFALSVVPRKFLIENEVFLRGIFAFHLRGNKYECTVCGHGLKKFIPIPDGDSVHEPEDFIPLLMRMI